MAKARIYAVGDIHGRLDLLIGALDAIEEHAGANPATIIFLGDYIDRGPSSREVVDLLMAGPARPQDRFICLMGNHEDMLCSAADAHEPTARATWIANGGVATLQSYGLDPEDESAATRVPAAHRAWMAGLPLVHQEASRIFVHAGLMPGVEIEAQGREALLYVRERFLRAGDVFGKHIVHGHTPALDGPELLSWRTNLDTGAVFGGRLSIGVFSSNESGGPDQILSV